LNSMQWRETPFIAVLLVVFFTISMVAAQPAWGQEVTGPQIKAAEVTTKGDLSITFDQTIADPAGIQAQFAVSVNDAAVNVTAVELTNTPGKIKLVLEKKAQAGQMIAITYTRNSDAALQIKSTDGEVVENFTYQIGEIAQPPALSVNNEQNKLGDAVEITFAGNPDWTAKITNVKVNDVSYKGQFAIVDGKITIPAEIFTAAGEYAIVVKATAYKDADIKVTIAAAEPVVDPVQPPVDPIEPPVDPVQPPVQAEFKDIQGHWAENNIKQLVAIEAIDGYGDGTFLPEKVISRAEFVTVLVKAFKLEASSDKTFADTANHWAKKEIAIANALGIVEGYSADSFGPDDSITREQMAVMVVKATKLAPVSTAATFADNSQISAWALDYVNTAFANQLIGGYGDNTYQPQKNSTRAESVTVILRALEKAA
jgi:uncharacterized repeat protein (TIGR02059 family)